MSSIVPDPHDIAGTPRPSLADESAAHWQAIARLSPAELYARIRMARSVLLSRFPSTPDRLDVERCLDGWYDR